MKKLFIIALLITLVACMTDTGKAWRTAFDLTMPELVGAGEGFVNANESGWYSTLVEDFDGDELPEPWFPSPHARRLKDFEYWCDDMVSMSGNGNAVIKADYIENHNCTANICATNTGLFTSGIETRKMLAGESVPTFTQAFGYYEVRVLFPKSGGMWSAFWLQTNSVEQLGNKGEDGSEIDIYESSFYNTDRAEMGHAIHYDGYGREHRWRDRIAKTGTDLYDGYHTFALKWTPTEYVFYIDGVVTWATDFGGVCKVPAFLRLTNEVRPERYGPYGQKLGEFDGGDFYIDYVKVYQNKAYLPYIKSADHFKLDSGGTKN